MSICPGYGSSGNENAAFHLGSAPALQTGALQMKSTVDDRGRTQLDFGKAEGLMPLWDMTEPAPEEDAPKATTARPWDDWDEWEFRSLTLQPHPPSTPPLRDIAMCPL